MIKNNKLSAWKIVYEMMCRSSRPLVLRMLHPCDEQYECLSLLNRLNSEAIAMVNIKGSSILLVQRDELIKSYPEKYENDSEGLLDDILRFCGCGLSLQPKRDLPIVAFLLSCIEEGFDAISAWYDGSYGCELSEEAKRFQHYPLQESGEADAHLSWWLVKKREAVIAACNLETGELILDSGKRYNLLNGEGEVAMIDMMTRDEWETTIKETKALLEKNDEWIKRYCNYADIISSNTDAIETARSSFREWDPLKFYLNVTNAKEAGRRVRFDVRFLGQAVAELTWSKSLVTLSTKGYKDKSRKAFGVDVPEVDTDWRSAEAQEFRRFFKNCSMTRNEGNEEHRIESMILSEMLKTKDKNLRNMKPVTIAGLRFPMPTPLKASDHRSVSYAKQYGGGIDVFARVGTGGRNTNLCIMELKDENNGSESPKDVVKQVLVYTTFIRELLRSECGENWWKLFGFKGEIPKGLVLFAACVMPSNPKYDAMYGNQDISLKMGGDDGVRIQHLYFTEKNNVIESVETSIKY